MTKDYIKFRCEVRNDTNLTLEEGYFLEVIFDYTCDKGYAYPSYEILMSNCKTCRRAKISKLIKALVKKGYIQVTKINRHNTYKLLKYLFINNSKGNNNNGHKEEVIEEQLEFNMQEINNIVTATGFTPKQATSLLKVAKDKVEKVLKGFEYALSMKAKNVYSYTMWCIKNNISKIDCKSKEKKLKFDNFEQREYDYHDLEWKLLGWS